jgi:hypothetical protein
MFNINKAKEAASSATEASKHLKTSAEQLQGAMATSSDQSKSSGNPT